jgi:hypothetical protein
MPQFDPCQTLRMVKAKLDRSRGRANQGAVRGACDIRPYRKEDLRCVAAASDRLNSVASGGGVGELSSFRVGMIGSNEKRKLMPFRGQAGTLDLVISRASKVVQVPAANHAEVSAERGRGHASVMVDSPESFLRKPPGAVPIGRWRVPEPPVDMCQQGLRWSIARSSL